MTRFEDFSDEELVPLILKNNREALAEIFRRYYKSFLNLAYRLSGDYELAKDLTSETFLRIYRYLKSYDASMRFKPWAFRVATNVCFSGLRNRKENKAKQKQDGEDDPDGTESVADSRVDLQIEMEKKELVEKIRAALMSLPEKYRLAVYLYYFEELKYEDIAKVLDLPVNTVRTHLLRGKKALRELLKEVS